MIEMKPFFNYYIFSTISVFPTRLRPSPHVVSFFCRHCTPNVGIICSNEILVSIRRKATPEGQDHSDPSLPLRNKLSASALV